MSAESKKKKELIALSILGLAAAYLVWSNFFSGPSVPEQTRPAVSSGSPASDVAAAVTMPGVTPKKAPSRNSRSGKGDGAFHAVYVPTRPEDRQDVTTIDPTLHLDRFAKVQQVEAAGGVRNLFAFGTAPPPKPVELPKGPEPKVKPGDLAKAGAKPSAPPPPKVDGPPPEVPLQINLKYYGIIAYTKSGRKTACFMDGEEILTATEGDTLKRRYKVVRIGTTSVVMEDTESKRQATIQIAQEAQQG